jgi:hypothetical protein
MSLVETGHLSRDTITNTLGVINTELKCSVLGAVTVAGASTDAGIFTALDARQAFALRECPPQNSHLGDIAERFPDSILHVERSNDTNRRQYTVAPELGMVATALAGELMYLSRESNTPLRVIVGETRTQGNSLKVSPSNAIANRLNIYHAITLAKTRRGWFNMPDVVTLAEHLFEGNGRAARRAIQKLVRARILESDQHGRHKKLRFNVSDDIRDPAVMIRQYLALVQDFATPSPARISAGISRLDDILSDTKILPYLIQRSYAATSHTGKNTVSSSDENA